VTGTDDQLDARAARGGDHCATVLQRQRHGLLDQYVLALRRCDASVVRVELVRRRNVDDFDRRVGAERLDRVVRLRAELPLELPPRLRARIGGGDQLDPGIGREGRDHQREGAAEAGDAELERRGGGHRGLVRLPGAG
jgi:hypothetical protein